VRHCLDFVRHVDLTAVDVHGHKMQEGDQAGDAQDDENEKHRQRLADAKLPP